jgi:hypothetical protein
MIEHDDVARVPPRLLDALLELFGLKRVVGACVCECVERGSGGRGEVWAREEAWECQVLS